MGKELINFTYPFWKTLLTSTQPSLAACIWMSCLWHVCYLGQSVKLTV